MKPIAIQVYSLRQQAKADLKGTLAQIAQMGYRGVELAGLYGYEPAEVKQMLDELDLQVAGAHVPPPSAENIDELLETYQILGANLLGTGVGADRFDSAKSIQQVADDFQSAAELLEQYDIGLVYHNHWWEMEEIDGMMGLDRLYEAAPALQAEIDTYWASNFGAVDVPAFVAKYASRTPLLHIKDGPVIKDEAHLAVGSGKMDVPAIIEAADQDILQWLIVELDRCDTDITEAVAASAKYLIDNQLGLGR